MLKFFMIFFLANLINAKAEPESCGAKFGKCFEPAMVGVDYGKDCIEANQMFYTATGEKLNEICESAPNILLCITESKCVKEAPRFFMVRELLTYLCYEATQAERKKIKECSEKKSFYDQLKKCYAPPTSRKNLCEGYFQVQYKCSVDKLSYCLSKPLLEQLHRATAQVTLDVFLPTCYLNDPDTKLPIKKSCNSARVAKCTENLTYMIDYLKIYHSEDDNKRFCDNIQSAENCFKEHNCFNKSASTDLGFRGFYDAAKYLCKEARTELAAFYECIKDETKLYKLKEAMKFDYTNTDYCCEMNTVKTNVDSFLKINCPNVPLDKYQVFVNKFMAPYKRRFSCS